MKVNWALVENAFDTDIEDNGVDMAFHLRDGTNFTIRGVARFTASVDMTDGLQQPGRRISVMAKRWDAASPTRKPEKGDQVTMVGVRYAIEDVTPAIVDNRVFGYRIRLKG